MEMLFICGQNYFCSQISEAIMNKKHGIRFVGESVKLNVGVINRLSIKIKC